MTEDPDSPAVAAFVALAAALGVTVAAREPDARSGRRPRYRASGRVDGVEVFLGGLQPWGHEIPVRIEAAVARDLRTEVFTNRPRLVYQQRDATVSDDLWFRGDGDRARARLLVAGPVGAQLRALAHLDVQLDDSSVVAALPVGGDVGAHVAQVRQLIALAAAAAVAATRIPVDPSLAWAGPRVAAAAAALGLAFTTCPLGFHGEVDGCPVTAHPWVWPRHHRSLLIKVAYRQVVPGTWALLARGRSWWQRVRGALGSFGGRSPRSGRFAFDRRFTLDAGGAGDRRAAVRAVAATIDPLIAFVDRSWLSVTGDRLVVGVWLRERTLPDLADLVRRAVVIAHQLGGAPAPGPAAGPFR